MTQRMAEIQILMRIELWISDLSWFQKVFFYMVWIIPYDALDRKISSLLMIE